MEGVAFQMRWALEYGRRLRAGHHEDQRGRRRHRWARSGPSSSRTSWNVRSRPSTNLRTPAAVGAAACAIVGSGAQPDFAFLRDRAAVKRTYLPDASRALDYSERYAHYRKLYEALYPIYHPTSGDEERL